MSFLLLYNYQKKLKSLKFQTPYDTIIQIYQDDPKYYKLNPESKSLGLNIFYVPMIHYMIQYQIMTIFNI